MATIKKFEDLEIWKDARILVNTIYKNFSSLKDFGYRDQILRASVSIMNNIAEGFEYNSNKSFRRYLIIAKSSCGEVRSMLYLAEDLNYLNSTESKILIDNTFKLSKKIGSLTSYLNKTNT